MRTLFGLLAALLLIGCDSEDTFVDPFDTSANKPFSAFGFVEQGERLHQVRVFPVRRTIEPPEDSLSIEPVAGLQARIVKVSSGAIFPLVGVIQRDASRNVSYLFEGNFDVQPGTYAFEMTRLEDGHEVRAEVFVPTLGKPESTPRFRSGNDYLPGRPLHPVGSSDSLRLPQAQSDSLTTLRVGFPELTGTLESVEVVYFIDNPQSPVFTMVPVQYPRAAFSPDRKAVDVNLTRDLYTVQDTLQERLDRGEYDAGDKFSLSVYALRPPLTRLLVRIKARSEGWPPTSLDGEANQEAAQSGLFSNMQGGYGYFGGLASDFVEVEVPEEAKKAASFR